MSDESGGPAPKTAPKPRPESRPFGFHPNVIALGLTSFFTDISTEMLVPVMPLFITATLGAAWGHDGSSGISDRVTAYFRVGKAF